MPQCDVPYDIVMYVSVIQQRSSVNVDVMFLSVLLPYSFVRVAGILEYMHDTI